MLDLTKKRLDYTIKIFDQAHAYCDSGGEDEEQVRTYAGTLISELLREAGGTVSRFEILNGYKRDDLLDFEGSIFVGNYHLLELSVN